MKESTQRGREPDPAPVQSALRRAAVLRILDPELHMVLKDRTGREFGTDVDSWEYVPTNLNIFLEPVNPGISKNGRVIYQVPPDAWGFTLKLDDVEFWKEESAVFDLSGMTLRAYTYAP